MLRNSIVLAATSFSVYNVTDCLQITHLSDMTKLQRRFYMLGFILLFLLTAPVIVLMAKGYRFDLQRGIFVYSGSVTMKSWPRSVDIYLDGKLQDSKKLNAVNSSYTINGVRPGRHHLRCEKDGHTIWEKNVDTHSGLSTEFWNILLFSPGNLETSSFDTASVEQYFLSPRKESEIVFFSSDEKRRIVSLLDTDNSEVEEIYGSDEFDFVDLEEKENVEWSSDNKRILIPFQEDGKKVYIIARIRRENLQDIIDVHDLFTDYTPVEINSDNKNSQGSALEKVASLSRGKQPDFQKVRWMFDKNDELVVLTKNHELFYVDINKPENKILIDTQVSGFDFAGNRIYYTQLPNNIIWEIRNDDISSKKQITKIPFQSSEGSFVKLIVYDQYRIALITEAKDLYVYNHEKEKGELFQEKVIEAAEDIQFSDDGKKLLYWTDNEIWNLMLRKWEVQPLREKGDQIFITRFSTPVKNVQWLDDYENIIFSANGKVKSAELDNRDHINIVDVMLSSDRSFAERDLIYNKANQLLYSRVKSTEKFQLQSSLLVDKTGLLGF